MKIKKYTGISLASIFSRVKSDLGEKAVILSTKKIPGSHKLGLPKIEVTAALTPPVFDKPVLSPKPIDEKACKQFLQAVREKAHHQQTATKTEEPELYHSQSSSTSPHLESEISEIKEILKMLCFSHTDMGTNRFSHVYKTLKTCHIEEDLILAITGQLGKLKEKTGGKQKEKKILEEILDTYMKAAPFSLKTGPGQVIVLLGTTGVGKTTTLAKLASLANLNHNLPVAFLSLDSFRAGAHEHLQQYARILGAPFHTASPHKDISKIVEKLKKDHNVFIDTSGFSQYNKLKIKEMHAVLRNIPESRKYLLFNASTHPAEIQIILKNFCSTVDINGLILTKLDESDRPGQIVSISRITQLPVCYITNGQIVPDNIHPADSTRLARKVLYGKYE